MSNKKAVLWKKIEQNGKFILLFSCPVWTFSPKKSVLGNARPRVVAHILSAVSVDGFRVARKEAIDVTFKLLRVDPEPAPAHFKNARYPAFFQRFAHGTDVDVELLLQLSVIGSVLPQDRRDLRARNSAALSVDQIRKDLLALRHTESDRLIVDKHIEGPEGLDGHLLL